MGTGSPWRRSTWVPSGRSCTQRTAVPSHAAATAGRASGRPSLSTSISSPSGEQHATTGAANRGDQGAATRPSVGMGARTPGRIAAMLVRMEISVSGVPANRRPARSSGARNASAR